MKHLRIGILAVITGWLFGGTMIEPAWALKQFQKEFWSVYLAEHADADYVELVKKKAKCNLCHDPTKKNEKGKSSKKFRNAYGEQLSKLLDKKKDKKNVEKIREALETVGKLPSDPKDAGSPTFDELITSGKLPAGPLPEKKS